MIGKKAKKLDTEANFKEFVKEQFGIVRVILISQQEFMPQMIVVYQCRNCKEEGLTLLVLPDIEEYLRSHEKINLSEKAIDAIIPCKCNLPMEVLAYVFIIHVENLIIILGKHLQLKETVVFVSNVIVEKDGTRIEGISSQYQEIPKEKYSSMMKKVFNFPNQFKWNFNICS